MRVRQEVPGLARLARHGSVELDVHLWPSSVRRGCHTVHVPSAFRVQRVDFSTLLHDRVAEVGAHVSLCFTILLGLRQGAVHVNAPYPSFFARKPVSLRS